MYGRIVTINKLLETKMGLFISQPFTTSANLGLLGSDLTGKSKGKSFIPEIRRCCKVLLSLHLGTLTLLQVLVIYE